MKEKRPIALMCLLLSVPVLANAQGKEWLATWTASPEWSDPNPKSALLNVEDQTVRERMRLSVGGAKMRIRFTNEYGTRSLLIGAATVGAPNDQAGVKMESLHVITFGGQKSVTISAGTTALSDPIAFPVTDGAEISVSVYFPKRIVGATVHELALKRAVISKHGDFTGVEKIDGGTVSKASISVSAVFVPARPRQRLVVAMGDSVVDGDMSTVDEDRSWPSDLARRLEKTPDGSKVAVVNEGVGGNRLLSDGFAAGRGFGVGFGLSGVNRFDRDALSLPGVTHIILLEGLNDIGFSGAKIGERYLAEPGDIRTAGDLIAAYKGLIERAHALGVKMIGATIIPFEGVDLPGYYSEAKEETRQEVNKWIRTSGAFDAVIDFDAVLRDPAHPGRVLARFSAEDHLHPNDEGYQAMADAIDLSLFK